MSILNSTPEVSAVAVSISGALELRISMVVLAILLAGCAVGPAFKKPTSDAPAGWSSWQSGDASLHDPDLRENQTPLPDRWWETFHDTTLNALESRARSRNTDLQTAALHFAQSRVQRQTFAAQRGPQVDATGSAKRIRESEHDASGRLIGAVAPTERDRLVQLLSVPYNLFQAGFDASWELDLWGRVRRSVEAADADVVASGAALDGVRIAVAAEVARNLRSTRSTDTGAPGPH